MVKIETQRTEERKKKNCKKFQRVKGWVQVEEFPPLRGKKMRLDGGFFQPALVAV